MRPSFIAPLATLTLALSAACVIETSDDDDSSVDTDRGSTGEAGSSSGSESTSNDDTSSGESSHGSTAALDESSSGTTGGPAFEHCEAPTELTSSGSANGSWPEANVDGEGNSMRIDYPAGGYITITHDPGPARGGIQAFGIGDVPVASTGEDEAGEAVTMSFSAVANQPFRLVAEQRASANPDEYPVSWSMSWEEVIIPDCWEPNDTPQDAKLIPFDEMIRGYGNLGLQEGNEFNQEQRSDYFAIDIPSAGDLLLDMTQVPGDGLLRMNLTNEAGEAIGGFAGAEDNDETSPFSALTTVDEAGRYYVEVHMFLTPQTQVPDDSNDGLPRSWTTPYQFELSFTPTK